MSDRRDGQPFFPTRCLTRGGILLLFATIGGLAAGGGFGWAAEHDRTARLRCGETFVATPIEIDEQGNVSFQTDSSLRTIPIKELVSWGAFRDSDRAPQIVLRDGSWLGGEIRELDADQLRLESLLWGRLSLPREAIRGILFNPSPDPLTRDLAREQLLRPAREDRLYLENGDVLSGQFQQLQPSADGHADTLRFATQGRPVLLAPENVTSLAFRFDTPTPSSPEPRMMIGLRDGSRLFVRRFETSGPLRRLLLDERIAFETDPAGLWSEVTSLQPLGGEVRYLSDLELSGYRHIPLLQQTRELGRDRNPRGGYLRSGDRLYLKGLGMPTAARVVCPLQGNFRRFEAELALDDLAGNRGSVVFRVFLSDNAGGWEPAYTSPPIRGGEPPVSIAIDVTGAQALVLLAEMGAWGDVRDYANWLNARLIP